MFQQKEVVSDNSRIFDDTALWIVKQHQNERLRNGSSSASHVHMPLWEKFLELHETIVRSNENLQVWMLLFD
jgi:dolichyl-phosphate-mannose--protein O-mannosyl transferase